jgi:hypothetical protein
MPCHKKRRKKRSKQRRTTALGELGSMNKMIGKSTQALAGVAVFGITANAVTNIIKK